MKKNEQGFIIELLPNECFVFGSNLLGIHRSGAARDAMEHFGAIYGQGEGLQGQSYALPTKSSPHRTLSLESVKKSVDNFLLTAKKFDDFNPTKIFYVSRVGCGLAGLKDKDIMPMFFWAPNNVFLPVEWKELGHKVW